MSKQNTYSHLPFVSVVIPFFNNHDEVIQIEKNLRDQTYPSERFEIIFIDNGSTKSFEFPDLFSDQNILLTENEYLNSPYSARNRGVENSKGEIIVFVDANSTPQNNWIEVGVDCFQKSESDLLGGNVQFDFKGKATAGKIVDALTSINMEKAIRERGAAYTANLFARKEVFERAGLFEEGVRSGGDVRWTLKAKKNGFKISYCENAVVKKFARSAKELYRKRIRTGKGYYYSWREDPNRRIWFYNFFRSLKPPSSSKVRKLKPGEYREELDQNFASVWFHLYASGILEQMAFMSEYVKNQLGIKKQD